MKHDQFQLGEVFLGRGGGIALVLAMLYKGISVTQS